MKQLRRTIDGHLDEWKDQSNRSPIIIRGARQIGKTQTVRNFAARSFEHFLEINFEKHPKVSSFFEDLNVHKMIQKLELYFQVDILPGKTLLFLDEIQESPAAMVALRYFKEDLPELHVIAAGSLLEFMLADEALRMPVGRVHFMYMKPMSFKEFLMASGQDKLLDHLSNVTLENPIDNDVHMMALEHVKSYSLWGGMPEVVSHYVDDQLKEARIIQSSILTTYEHDFIKYGHSTQFENLRLLFKKVPLFVGEQIKYVRLNPDSTARPIKKALDLLERAGVLRPIYATAASGISLDIQVNENSFKCLFLDVGLLQNACDVDPVSILNEPTPQLNRGGVAEQLVGQELIAYQDPYKPPKLYFWKRDSRNSQAEVDYLVVKHNRILPIEVKAGRTGRLKSLQLFLEEKKQPLGLKLSEDPLSLERHILSVPFYLIWNLDAILNSVIKIG